MPQQEIKVTIKCLEQHENDWSSLLQYTIYKENRQVTFRFLINCGADFFLKSAYTDYLSQVSDIDLIVLTGSTIPKVGGLPQYVSNNIATDHGVNKQYSPIILCTDPIYKFSKLNLYDRVTVLNDTTLSIELPTEHVKYHTLSPITLDDIDLCLTHFHRVKYSEIYTVSKSWRTNNHSAESESDLCPLTLQAFPSGKGLGDCVWLLYGEGVHNCILIGPQFTIKPNWFFDGLKIQDLPKNPMLLITSCPFYQSENISQSFIPHKNSTRINLPMFHHLSQLLPSISSASSAQQIITKTTYTLNKGGSVLIPVDLGLDALKLLILFEAAWTSSLRAFPILFITPTGSLLIEFTKTMLSWTSSLFRDRFCSTRRNPFEQFNFIHFFASFSAAEKLYLVSTPKVIISTPASLCHGETRVRNVFLTVCNDPKSLIIFPRTPSKDIQACLTLLNTLTSFSVKRTYQKRYPPDELYQMYLETRPVTDSNPDIPNVHNLSSNEDTHILLHHENDLELREEKNHGIMLNDSNEKLTEFIQNSEDDPMFTPTNNIGSTIHPTDLKDYHISTLLDKYLSDNNTETIPSTIVQDEYGEIMSPNDKWPGGDHSPCHEPSEETDSICVPLTVPIIKDIPIQDTASWLSGVSAKRLQRLRLIGFDKDKRSTVSYTNSKTKNHVDLHITEEINDDENEDIPLWRKHLRSINNGTDPVGTKQEIYVVSFKINIMICSGLFDTDSIFNEFSSEMFSEWVTTSLCPLNPKHIIFYPPFMNQNILHSLLSASSHGLLPHVPVCSFCEYPLKTNEFDNTHLNVKEEDYHGVNMPTERILPKVTVSKRWNELLVDLDPAISLLIKQTQNKQSNVALNVLNFPVLFSKNLSSNVKKSTLDYSTLLYVQLQLPFTNENKLISSSNNQQINEQTHRMESSQIRDVVIRPYQHGLCNSFSEQTESFIDAMEELTDTDSEFSPIQQNMSIPINRRWVCFGQVQQRDILKSIGSIFPSVAIRAAPGFAFVDNRAAIQFSLPHKTEPQSVHLHGGFDLTTVVLRKQLKNVFAQTGSVFKQTDT